MRQFFKDEKKLRIWATGQCEYQEVRITAAAAEGRTNTAGKKCGKQTGRYDTIGLERQLWSSEEKGSRDR